MANQVDRHPDAIASRGRGMGWNDAYTPRQRKSVKRSTNRARRAYGRAEVSRQMAEAMEDAGLAWALYDALEVQ